MSGPSGPSVVTGLAGARAVRALPAGVAFDQSGSTRS
jgi:hypothetical protein